ncbi:unnamed protein product [Caenorhabditis angaria]|uniref:Large ribosomal subunit protein mL46 n=1 Tax=Caenorhabditis angaria TaxID=860376 RepID=A0A9P1IPX6_9PELO|nr:unnamed protein product [Caenorhabditis angaria]
MHLSSRFLGAQAAQKWDIIASVVLSRPPVIAPKMLEIEKRYQKLQLEEESENSLMNNYELKTKQDQKMLARREQLLKEGKELSELDEEIGVTNAVREDEWNKKAEELQKRYNFSKIAEETDPKSLSRLLDRKLVLIVKQNFGEKKYSSPWILPQMKNKEGETLRQTAERCIGEIAGGDLSASISGNAPFSVFSHKYPKPITQKTGQIGAKIFFYTANLAQNTTDFEANKDDVADFRWVTREEFWSTVPGKEYRNASKFAFLE